MEQLAGELGRNTQVLSPIEGRVLEIKVSAGLRPECRHAGDRGSRAEGTTLEALVYIPADRGKSVKPGMEVRLEPSTVKREEFGTMVGTVVTVSDFPITPQGMAAVLHNDSLVTRFSQAKARPTRRWCACKRDESTGQRISLGGRKRTAPPADERNADAGRKSPRASSVRSISWCRCSSALTGIAG